MKEAVEEVDMAGCGGGSRRAGMRAGCGERPWPDARAADASSRCQMHLRVLDGMLDRFFV